MNKFSILEIKKIRLTNGCVVDTNSFVQDVEKSCHYISHAVILEGSDIGRVALIFPDKKLFSHPEYSLSPDEGCFCPRNIKELGKCITGCLNTVNSNLALEADKIKSFAIIDAELSMADGTLSTDLNVVPEKVLDIYHAHIDYLFNGVVPIPNECFIGKIE